MGDSHLSLLKPAKGRNLFACLNYVVDRLCSGLASLTIHWQIAHWEVVRRNLMKWSYDSVYHFRIKRGRIFALLPAQLQAHVRSDIESPGITVCGARFLDNSISTRHFAARFWAVKNFFCCIALIFIRDYEEARKTTNQHMVCTGVLHHPAAHMEYVCVALAHDTVTNVQQNCNRNSIPGSSAPG